uniref:BTB domain-containing protein n=1 Tax=Panagrolaimus superbus TaxID=310955 RepID=A0A914Y2C7_9BILA
MKEKSDNCVEIIEFNPEIVEKMIEFCESDDIKEYENCEEDLFKIAHKYEILVLMEFAVEKMAESLSFSNIEARLQIANLYDLKEFKKWCMQFVFRNNIEIEY